MFKSIANFFKNIFFPKVKVFLKSVFSTVVQIAIAETLEFAREAVKELSFENLNSAEKREEAFKRVSEALKASGKDVQESVIRTTIEMAVLELKNAVPKEA